VTSYLQGGTHRTDTSDERILTGSAVLWGKGGTIHPEYEKGLFPGVCLSATGKLVLCDKGRVGYSRGLEGRIPERAVMKKKKINR